MPPPGSSGRPPPVRSVARALDALEVLTSADEVGLSELARRLALPPSTMHRLLSTLAYRGWVTQNPGTGRYLIGMRALGLAARLHERTAALRAAARPYLERARKVSGAAAQLAVLECTAVALDRTDVVYLDAVEAPGAGASSPPGPTVPALTSAPPGHPVPAHASAPHGHTVPAHASAPGKALLAQVPEDRLTRPGSPYRYEPRTGRTITSPAALRRELAAVRRVGYAIEDEELAAGVASVAAPVFAATGEPVAAISVSGAAARMREVGLRELGEFLVILTGELSRELGGGAA